MVFLMCACASRFHVYCVAVVHPARHLGPGARLRLCCYLWNVQLPSPPGLLHNEQALATVPEDANGHPVCQRMAQL